VNSTRTTQRETFGNPLLQEQVHDPYRERRKLAGITSCPECGAHYRNGRWTWPDQDTKATRSSLCPACRRIQDHCPAGELVLEGTIDDSLRDQILARVRNIEDDEHGQRPLHRIMAVESKGDNTVVTTTDVHLPHRFGHAIKDAWGGELQTHYDRDGYFARIVWQPQSG